MIHILNFKMFLETTDYDSLYNDKSDTPKYNPSTIIKAKEFVETYLVNSDLTKLFKLAKMEIPEKVSDEERVKKTEQAIDIAVRYYVENPELMNDPTFDYIDGDNGSQAPLVQNI